MLFVPPYHGICNAFGKSTVNAQLTSTVLLQSIPDVAVEVIITAKQEPAALRKCHRCDAADDVVVRVHADLLVSTDVKQQASRIVRPRRKCKSTWKKLHTAPQKGLKIIIYLSTLVAFDQGTTPEQREPQMILMHVFTSRMNLLSSYQHRQSSAGLPRLSWKKGH